MTNIDFERSRVSELKQKGRSKEKRHDMPLMTPGLLLDEESFPKQSHLFPGNISEPEKLMHLHYRNTLKGKKEKYMLEFHRLRFEEELKNAVESLHKKKGTRSYPRVLEFIYLIKERQSGEREKDDFPAPNH